MVIGIQTNNRLPPPGTGETPKGPGRSLSENTLDAASGSQAREIPQSTPVAGQPAIVQLNFSGTGSLDRALLAGYQATTDPTVSSQDSAVPPVQDQGRSATGALALPSASWVPGKLAQQIAQLGLGGGLLDGSFINATREFAYTLLAASSSRPARVVPLAAEGGESAGAQTQAPAGTGPGGLGLLVDLLTDMTPGLSEQGKAQLKRLGKAVQAVRQSYSGNDAGERLQAPSPSGRGFTFQIELRQTAEVDATVARLNENGFQAARVQASAESVTRIQITVGAAGGSAARRADPVVLDLDRDGEISLNALGQGGGQAFDIDGNGTADRTSFVAGGDAFLALDRNGNGRIDDGTELFGDQTGAANGMADLARLDADGDGRITRRDPLFGQLSAFYDLNGDGKVAAGEFRPLAQLGITALDLGYQAVREERADGNAISAKSRVEYADGSTGLMADADLTCQ